MREGRRTIVCLSHLSWDNKLFQRPQQLMLRLSRDFDVVFVNEPSFFKFLKRFPRPGQAMTMINEGLTVYTPFAFPTLMKAFAPVSRFNLEVVLPFLLRRMLKVKNSKAPILWLYHPRYRGAAEKLEAEALVYDCMDDFGSLYSSREDTARIARDEAGLIEKADVVFAGGESIGELKRRIRKDVHVFPSAVEIAHFKKALTPGLPAPDDMASIPRPVLGYWGAVDNRLDHALLKGLAERHPEWSVVLLGPLVRLTADDLPYMRELKNVHWLGPKDYSLLPLYAKAFDVCLNPFVLTKEGIYLSPTKTLEYLASGKPVVSTPIPDVARFYGGIVHVADGVYGFEKAVKKALEEESEALRAKRVAFTDGRSWEGLASAMMRLVLEGARRRKRIA